eukprot:17084-Karenia_brevis.AAC.1
MTQKRPRRKGVSHAGLELGCKDWDWQARELVAMQTDKLQWPHADLLQDTTLQSGHRPCEEVLAPTRDNTQVNQALTQEGKVGPNPEGSPTQTSDSTQ